jgi:hypothetical protein
MQLQSGTLRRGYVHFWKCTTIHQQRCFVSSPSLQPVAALCRQEVNVINLQCSCTVSWWGCSPILQEWELCLSASFVLLFVTYLFTLHLHLILFFELQGELFRFASPLHKFWVATSAGAVVRGGNNSGSPCTGIGMVLDPLNERGVICCGCIEVMV